MTLRRSPWLRIRDKGDVMERLRLNRGAVVFAVPRTKIHVLVSFSETFERCAGDMAVGS